MSKKIKITLLLLWVMLAVMSPIKASAYADADTGSIAESAGAGEIENPFLEKDELSGDKTINVFEKTLSIIRKTLNDSGRSVIKSFGLIMSVVILCCVMHAIKFGGDGLDTVSAYISVIVLSSVTYSVLYDLFVFVIAALESLVLAMTSFMPIMASLYAFGGATASAAASASSFSVFLTILSTICARVIMPLLQISFAFCLSGAIPGSINLSSAASLVKNTATTLMSFLFMLLGFVLYIQTAVAAASDSFFARSVRFASGVFVPVIGSMLGDASRTVISSVSVIKGTVGGAGVVVVLSFVLPPFLLTILYKFMLLLSSVLAKSLGCEKESAFLYDLGGVLGVVMALVGGATAVCIIAMATFIRVGVSA